MTKTPERLTVNQYGFVWGDDRHGVLVERTCSNQKNPIFKVIRVFGMNGELIEILCRPGSTTVIRHEKEKE